MDAPMNKEAFGVRVYEYLDDEGNQYFSFVKHRQTVSPPMRLVLQDRLGTPFLRFINLLRKKTQEGSGMGRVE